MADESDVEVALVAAAAAAVYPNGAAAPPPGGTACRIIRGEPNPEALNVDLAAGVVNVTVSLMEKMSRNTTRYSTAWQPAAVQAVPGLAVSMSGNVASFSGTGGAGSIVGVQVMGQGYTYATLAGDTPGSVAAALAQQVPGATASGAALTLPARGGTPLAVVHGYAAAVSELRRQEQGFTVAVLAPTPDARTAIASAIDQALSNTEFLALADGSAGRLRYHSTRVDDVPSRANLWRRDLLYTVEYGTTALMSVPEMVFGTLSVNAAPVGSVTQ